MEAEASGVARGACISQLAPGQEGDALEARAGERCRVELAPEPEHEHVRPVWAGDGTLAAGDELWAAGNERLAAAGAEEEVAAEEEPAVQQGPCRAERGPEWGLVTVEQFAPEGEDLIQVVQVVAEDEGFGAGGRVWLDLHLGRQEEVLAEEVLEEGEEHEVPRGPDEAGEWDREERMQRQLVAGDQFELEGEDRTQEGQVVEEAEGESQAEAKERGEAGSVKREQAGPAHGGPSTWSPLEALQALQAEMQPLNEQAGRAFSRLRRRNRQRRQPHLELRSTVIQHMHGFWARAFVNHPELSAMISDQDENMLSFMMDLKVEKDSDRCKIVLLFHSNPYFRNDVIVKEYIITLTGPRASYSTPIQWHAHFEGQAYSRRHHNSSLNFFNWFSEHDLAGSGRIVEFICNDLWPNPLKYYLRKTAAGDGAETRTEPRIFIGGLSVVTVDFIVPLKKLMIARVGKASDADSSISLE